MKNKIIGNSSKIAYMCATAFEEDLSDNNPGLIEIFASLESCRRNCYCLNGKECSPIRIKITLEQFVT